jgi:hypothetical protein
VLGPDACKAGRLGIVLDGGEVKASAFMVTAPGEAQT